MSTETNLIARSYTLPSDCIEWLNEKATSEGRSASNMLRRILEREMGQKNEAIDGQ